MKNIFFTIALLLVSGSTFAQHYRHQPQPPVRHYQTQVFSHYEYREVCREVRYPNRIHSQINVTHRYGNGIVNFGYSSHQYRNRYNSRIACTVERYPVYITRTVNNRRYR